MTNPAVEKAALEILQSTRFWGLETVGGWEKVLVSLDDLYQQGKADGAKEKLDAISTARQSRL